METLKQIKSADITILILKRKQIFIFFENKKPLKYQHPEKPVKPVKIPFHLQSSWIYCKTLSEIVER